MAGIELTHRDRTELPGRAVAPDREGVHLDGVRALWSGLGLH
ncbi:hypothetical protein [Kitasatospora indigofera]|nr:hypothetical protein [Kitasatospora indigofera]